MAEAAANEPRGEGFWLRIIFIASALLLAAIAFLVLGPRPAGTAGRIDVSALPAVNASLNAVTTVLLLTGWVLVLKRKVAQHKTVMLGAFATSSAFLVSYVLYHWFSAGPTKYQGDFRGLYLFVLLTHIVLAAAITPLALLTLYRGWSMRVQKHRKIAKVTLPLWLYVSVTGVAIYLMLHA
jgi:putative membrane protein